MLKLLKFSFFIFLISLSNASDKPLYFIHSGPTGKGHGFNIPYETRIYKFDETKKEFEQVWSLGRDKEAGKIAVYPSPGIVLISGEGYMPDKLYVFPMNNVEAFNVIKFDKKYTTHNLHYYYNENSPDLIDVGHGEMVGDSIKSLELILYTIGGNTISYPEGATDSIGEIRLCGGRPIGCNEFDIFGFYKIPQGKTRPIIQLDYKFDGTHINDSVIQMESSRGWNLIANEPQFYALSSVPDRNGLTQREILIYNRLEEKWSSFLIKGATTSLRLVNNWLTGEVKQMNPESDYEDRSKPKSGDIFTGEVVLINPLAGIYFTVDLGVGYSVLWVENDIVYYKTVTHTEAFIHKAKIENNKFVNVELLSNDPIVRYFRWAFRGK